jgi:hypothetical protein
MMNKLSRISDNQANYQRVNITINSYLNYDDLVS